jgi:hypothetical protein
VTLAAQIAFRSGDSKAGSDVVCHHLMADVYLEEAREEDLREDPTSLVEEANE